jgi:succinate dehydrogenase/fumarate reductase flavoprotein subunit
MVENNRSSELYDSFANGMKGTRLMTMRSLAIVFGLALAVMTSAPAEARRYSCGYSLHYDYSHSNFLSPRTYIYPAANWGPFFQCRYYSSPVVYLPRAYQPQPY